MDMLLKLTHFSNEDLLTDKWGGIALHKNPILNMNQIVRFTKQHE